MPTDSQELRQSLGACMPSFVIDAVAKESGQRVVYFGHFDDALVPADLPPDSSYLKGWHLWGPIVVKVVSGITPSALTYLQREAEILKGIDSRHFPRLQFGEVFTENPITEEKLPERLYVTVEERVDALPLSLLMEKYKTDIEVARLLRKLCLALTTIWLHPKRLVHRDIKPDNILVRSDGDVVVIDLGIVRETGAAGSTLTAMPFGPMSPAYASPEQVRNDKYSISFKSDFFSLGIIGYQLLTSENPFCPTSDTPIATVMNNVLTLAPEPLETKAGCSRQLSELISKLLEKDAYKRPRTPQDLIASLSSFIGD